MKKNILIIFSLFLWLSVFATEKEVESKITKVTVYPDSALVTRSITVNLEAGKHKIIFTNIIPTIDEDSLRASVDKPDVVKIFDVQLKKDFTEDVQSERVKKLKDEIQNLKDEIRKIQDRKSILLDKKAFLDSIRFFSDGQIQKELVTKMPSAKDLEDLIKFLETKLSENYSQILECDIRIRELEKKLDALQRQLSAISSESQKIRHSISVGVYVLKPEKFNLNVSYLVRNASWRPFYEARANLKKDKVNLVAYGIVRQVTGEDWNDVEVYLSTAKPKIFAKPPEISSWFLTPFYPPQSKYRVRSEGYYSDVELSAYRDLDPYDAPTVEKRFDSVVEEKGVAVVYKILEKATIKSDGVENKLPMFFQDLPAKFEYYTYPRASLYCYLGSLITNSKDFQLLAGIVNIFFEDEYVAKSEISNVSPGEEFHLYFGIDENVKVTRELIERKDDDVLIANLPAPNKKITLKYKVTIENYKDRKIKVRFFESTPVSSDEKIKTKVINVNVSPTFTDWKDKRGVWLWELELEPKQKKEIFYTFVIEHPRNLYISGL